MASTFETLVARLTSDASRAQPRDALQWCSNWFQQRLEEQRARSRGELARPPSYRTSQPNDLFVDTPIRSNHRAMEGPDDETVSRYPRAPPRHLPSPPNFRGPSPFGILNAPGNVSLDGGASKSSASPSISDIEYNPPVEPMSSSGLYPTYRSTSTSPAADQPSPARSGDILFPPYITIPARRTPVGAEFIVVNNGSTESLPAFPETTDHRSRIRNSIASNLIFRSPDEEQETEEQNAMQVVRLEADETVVRQRDVDEHSCVVEPNQLSRYIHPEPLSSPWISGKPSTTSLPSEGKLVQRGSPLVQSPATPPGPLALGSTANSFIDPQLLYGVCESFSTTREHGRVVDNLDPSPSQHSGSTHRRSPASRRRSKGRCQMSSLCPLEGLCPSAFRHRTGVIC